MTQAPYIADPDFTLHVGDALTVLSAMPAESVHCCVTSPPYWGLRDYGTGTWGGGDPDCDHLKRDAEKVRRYMEKSTLGAASGGHAMSQDGLERTLMPQNFYGLVCGKCGATRVDQQLGLEPTPDEYVANMVNVFREVRRVLRGDGTFWLNLGDSHQNKQLQGTPWRVAFALQADGWYLRSDIIWAKPNPMPESVTDRPTKAHEYLFLLTKSPRYFYDADAIRETATWDRWGDQTNGKYVGRDGMHAARMKPKSREELQAMAATGRNKRSVWEIATEAYPDAHFATFPQALVEPCIKAGCPEWVCGTCGKPRERITEREKTFESGSGRSGNAINGKQDLTQSETNSTPDIRRGPVVSVQTVGWSDCGHNNYQPGVVLDAFLGSGTTAQVARRLGRKSVGIELNPEYAQLAARRLQQQTLFACTIDESAGQAETTGSQTTEDGVPST